MQELLRRLAEQVVNAVMDAAADQLCGGGANSRNGYRERSPATSVGTLTLRLLLLKRKGEVNSPNQQPSIRHRQYSKS